MPFIQKAIEPKLDKRKERKKLSTEEKKKRHSYTESDYMYGEHLFEPSFLKKEAIVLRFPNFTNDFIRISEDGRFGIKIHEFTKKAILFHFRNPIKFDINLREEAIFIDNEKIQRIEFKYLTRDKRIPESLEDNLEDFLMKLVNIIRISEDYEVKKVDDIINNYNENKEELLEENEKNEVDNELNDESEEGEPESRRSSFNWQ